MMYRHRTTRAPWPRTHDDDDDDDNYNYIYVVIIYIVLYSYDMQQASDRAGRMADDDDDRTDAQ